MPERAHAPHFVHLAPSRQLTLVLGGVHVGALACALANELPLAVRAAVAVCALLSARRCISLHATCGAARAIVLLAWDGQGRWRLVQRDGQVLDARLEHGGYSHPMLVALPFRTSGGRRVCVLIVADRIRSDTMRRLRVRLRCMSGSRDNAGSVC